MNKARTQYSIDKNSLNYEFCVNEKAFKFGLSYLFFNFHDQMRKSNEDFTKSYKLQEAMKRFSKKLQNRGFTDNLQAQKLLDTMQIPTFDELTSIDRIWSEKSKISSVESDSENEAAQVWKLLKETRIEFLNAIVRYKQEADHKIVCLHPMDILYHIFRNAKSETSRILIENLDKMKIAFPIVLPSYIDRPKLLIWPSKSIYRQTSTSNFNIYSSDHHVVACVRMSDSNTLPKKSSNHSKSDILNQIFFRGQPKFISRNHPVLTNQNDLKRMRRIHDGAIESAIFTPNTDPKFTELNQFFEVWNLSGHINNAGLQPQIKMIKCLASSIIVFVENDEDFEMKEKQIIEAFGSDSKIVVVILEKNAKDDSSSSDSDEESDEEKPKRYTHSIPIIQYLASQKETSFQSIRKFVGGCLHPKPNFSYSKLITQRSDFRQDFLTEFEMDMDIEAIRLSYALVNKMGYKLKKLIEKHSNDELQEIIFPMYFSMSPLDKTKKIVEHIEFLNENKVKLFNIHQRGEIEQDNEIDKKIERLRLEQVDIAGRSEFVKIYLQQIETITSDSTIIESEEQEEWIRIYHRLLAHKLASFGVNGLDIVGFQRELGQLYVSTISGDPFTKKKGKEPEEKELKSKIITCFEQLINAGVSIELVDGDTQKVNGEIILNLLNKIE